MQVEKKLLLFFLAVLFFVWPIPNTISVREISLAASLCLATFLIYKNRISFEKPEILKTSAWLYALFLAWAVIVALFISPYTLWSLKEIKTEWVMGSLVIALGIEIALLASNDILSSKRIFLLLFLTLLAHAVFINAHGVYTVIRDPNYHGELTFLTRNVSGLTKGPIDASVAVDFLMTMLFAESFVRAVYKKSYLPVGGVLLAAGLVLSITASFFCGMRNTAEVLSIAASGELVLLLSGDLRKKLPLAALLLFFLAFAAIAFFKSDSRWTGLKRSVELAWATDYDWNGKTGGGYSTEPVKGEQVSRSNYIRFEMLRKSLNIIRNNPLGVGFGRNAFGREIMAEYGGAAGLSAESAVLDIFIGTGLVGGTLLILIYMNLFRAAIAYFKKYRDFLSVWLLLMLISFGSRMMLDSILNHMLHQFLFITSLLIVLTANEKKGEIKAVEGAPCIIKNPEKKLAS